MKFDDLLRDMQVSAAQDQLVSGIKDQARIIALYYTSLVDAGTPAHLADLLTIDLQRHVHGLGIVRMQTEMSKETGE